MGAVRWVGRKLCAVVRAILGMLWAEKSPLIVTIALAVFAALLAPAVNERFERQKMRSEYVLNNLKDMNGSISELYVDVTDINYAVAQGQRAPVDKVIKAREVTAELNWKLIEIAAMLPAGQRQTAIRFQQSVGAVRETLDGNLDLQGCQNLLRQVSHMALDGALLIQEIGRHVELGTS